MKGEGKNEAIAIFVVIIVILAAVIVGVNLKDDKNGDNPNGILGVYEIVDYTMYGTENGIDWKYYGPESGLYANSEIDLKSYNKGILTGAFHINGKEYSIAGYYVPETCAFGYGCKYDYAPGGGNDVNDLVHGYIIGDTMYVRGLTTSVDESSNLMYAYDFTYVKQGKVPEMVNFKQVIGSETPFGAKMQYRTSVDEKGEPVSESSVRSFSLSSRDYRNGVYDLRLTAVDGAKTEIIATAYTMYQDDTRTFIRGVMKNPNYDMFWICVEGDQLYIVESTFDSEKNVFSKLTSYMSTGEIGTWNEPYNISGMKYDTSVLVYFASANRYTNMEFVSAFGNRFDGTFITPMFSNGKWTLMTVLPDVDYVAFNTVTKLDGELLYSDMFGYIYDGEIITYGFAFNENGEAVVAQGINRNGTLLPP